MKSLTLFQKYSLLLISFILVAFGQPAWIWWFGLITSVIGFALFWRVLLDIPRPLERFCVAMGWYSAVQVVQLSWAVSHPYAYIYVVLMLLAWIIGAQCGLVALWIVPHTFKSWIKIFALTALWTLLEWSRLFIFSGLSFNPSGMALTGSVYTLQMASIGGVYFLSLWIILTNFAALRAWLSGFKLFDTAVFATLAIVPYIFGFSHYYFHEKVATKSPTISVLLIQPALPIEENMGFQSAEEARAFVLEEWKTILETTKKQLGQHVDLIVLPEYVVPYGTFYPIYPIDSIKTVFIELFGPSAKNAFPHLNDQLGSLVKTNKGKQWLVSNAFIAQTFSNLFNADLIVGLEDSTYIDEAQTVHETYSAAFHFKPGSENIMRYEKQILLPMGEYIPFDWCKKLAAKYGISGSFTPGKGGKIFDGPVPMGASICYEETFGDLMRDARVRGAELLVNLTNDGWYPNSRLPRQHFEHSRLRTVENGIPLVRACNTGLTGACDSLGRIIALLGENDAHAQQLSDSIRLDVPTYHYHTLYTRWGDYFILSLCCLALFIAALSKSSLFPTSF
jgi:apolipoprotein N-acyltransferase